MSPGHESRNDFYAASARTSTFLRIHNSGIPPKEEKHVSQHHYRSKNSRGAGRRAKELSGRAAAPTIKASEKSTDEQSREIHTQEAESRGASSDLAIDLHEEQPTVKELASRTSATTTTTSGTTTTAIIYRLLKTPQAATEKGKSLAKMGPAPAPAPSPDPDPEPILAPSYPKSATRRRQRARRAQIKTCSPLRLYAPGAFNLFHDDDDARKKEAQRASWPRLRSSGSVARREHPAPQVPPSLSLP